jgi:hypothetical protein
MKGLVDRSKNQNNLPHMAVFFEGVFEAFEGSAGVGRAIKELYDSEDTKNSDRVRLMCAIFGGVKDLYDRGLTKNKEDEDETLMSDEQILAEMMGMTDELLDEIKNEGKRTEGTDDDAG